MAPQRAISTTTTTTTTTAAATTPPPPTTPPHNDINTTIHSILTKGEESSGRGVRRAKLKRIARSIQREITGAVRTYSLYSSGRCVCVSMRAFRALSAFLLLLLLLCVFLPNFYWRWLECVLRSYIKRHTFNCKMMVCRESWINDKKNKKKRYFLNWSGK